MDLMTRWQRMDWALAAFAVGAITFIVVDWRRKR